MTYNYRTASLALLNSKRTLGGLAILLALALGLFLLSGVPARAQDDTIPYEENSTDAVATFTAIDPEGRPVYWSILGATDTATDTNITPGTDSADAAHFSISADGVLSFVFSPDYEAPRGDSTSTDNSYSVVVVAADEPQGASGRVESYRKVTVNVTNVDETGMVTLSTEQPQDGVSLTATLTDDDASDAQITGAKWKWEHSNSKSGPWTLILTATSATYSPLGVTDKYLRVTATYDDEHGKGKTEMEVSAHAVRAVPAANNAVPVFPSSAATRSVDENSPPGTAVGDPVAANDAPGDILTYTLSGSGTNDGLYRIDQATGQLTVGPRTSLDHETAAEHTVEVVATDPAGSTTGAATRSVTIAINDVNEVPVITAGDTKASVPENTGIGTRIGASAYTAYPEVSTTACAADTCTWSLKGPDAGDFNISNTGTLGELTFKVSPNYEAPADADGDNVYMVTVVVTDAGKGKLSAERDVVVTVTNVDEPVTNPTQVVTLSSLVPKVGVPLTATLDDPDGGEKDIKWQWRITGASTVGVPGTPTATTDGNISGATSDTYTPKINDVGGTLTVTVMYADAEGSGKSGTAATTGNPVVQDFANKAPVFDPKPTSRSVPENYATGDQYPSPANTYTYPAVGAVVTATDPNGDTLTYSLGGTDAGAFSLDQTSGQISVKTSTKLDLEEKATYMVTVTATDPGKLSDSVDVTINVTNKDEGPVITCGGLVVTGPASISVEENRPATTGVATYRAAGPDAATAIWSLSGADAANFTITGGELRFRTSPNYERPADANTDNTYEVTVTANDGTNTAEREVTVTVTDIVEQGSGDPLVDRYDTNSNGEIDKQELIDVIIAFVTPGVADKPAKQDVVELIIRFIRLVHRDA